MSLLVPVITSPHAPGLPASAIQKFTGLGLEMEKLEATVPS